MIDRMDDPKQIVARGYDRIAERYATWTGDAWAGNRARFGGLLCERLSPGAAVLDLGCGTGVPVARELAKRFAVTGVDLSPRSIALAKENVPGTTFFRADMSALDFPAERFDAVTAFYSIIHLPREEHPALLRAIAGWLRPGGLFVATMGAGESDDGYEEDWLGTPMYWSHYDGTANRRLVEASGLRLLLAEERTEDEDGVPVRFLWVVAQKPGDPGEGDTGARDSAIDSAYSGTGGPTSPSSTLAVRRMRLQRRAIVRRDTPSRQAMSASEAPSATRMRSSPASSGGSAAASMSTSSSRAASPNPPSVEMRAA